MDLKEFFKEILCNFQGFEWFWRYCEEFYQNLKDFKGYQLFLRDYRGRQGILRNLTGLSRF